MNGIFHQCYSPIVVEGAPADKEGLAIREWQMIRPTPFGLNPAAVRTNYVVTKCAGPNCVAVFYVPGMISPGVGTSIQIVPFQDESGNWPNLSYLVTVSLDGVHFVALPTNVSGTISSAAGPIHSLVFPVSVYRVSVQMNSDDGYFAVISN